MSFRMHNTRLGGMRTCATAWIALTCATFAAPLSTSAGDNDLGSISRRLREGDRAAIEELLLRTHASGTDLTASNARLDRLRAEVNTLRTRRAARPSFPVFAEQSASPLDNESAAALAASTRVDGLREAQAWLRAGEPDRALKAIVDEGEQSLYVEARALEGLGRRSEALVIFRRVAAEATAPLLRARAAEDVAHLEWRERVVAARGGRP